MALIGVVDTATGLVYDLDSALNKTQGDITQEINNQTGTTYALVDSDHGKLVTLSNAATIELTVPSGLRADFECVIQQKGAGDIDVIESGVTINIPEGVPGTSLQWTMFGLRQTDTNIFTASVGSYADFANDNMLINGNFAVAQRGTSFTAALNNNNDGDYNLDGWYVLTEGVDTVDISQSTDAPEGSGIGGKSVVLEVATVGAKFGEAQIVEASKSMEAIGRDTTFSFYAKVSNARIDTIKAAIVSWSGTEDVVTRDIVSTWNADGTTPTLIANATFENTPVDLSVGTTWDRYYVTANVDTASAKNLILLVWSDDATNPLVGDQLYIANAKAEASSRPSRFVPKQYAINLTEALPRYERINAITSYFAFGSGTASDTTTIEVLVEHARKRSSLWTIGSGGNFVIFRGAVGIAVTSLVLSHRGDGKTVIQATVASGLTDGLSYSLRANNDATAYLEFPDDI